MIIANSRERAQHSRIFPRLGCLEQILMVMVMVMVVAMMMNDDDIWRKVLWSQICSIGERGYISGLVSEG
jgi:uncharacterized protein YqhQ